MEKEIASPHEKRSSLALLYAARKLTYGPLRNPTSIHALTDGQPLIYHHKLIKGEAKGRNGHTLNRFEKVCHRTLTSRIHDDGRVQRSGNHPPLYV